MDHLVIVGTTVATGSLELDAKGMRAQLERGKYLVLVLMTVFYGIGVVRHAANRPLWYDEIITFISASAPDAASAWRAAQETDASPPLPHLLSHFSMQWFGSGEVALRLPAIIGFWVFCLCMFRFVRRRAGVFWGLVALLLPMATEAYNYAYEARAYGPELGFSGLLLVAWQNAVDGRRRVLAWLVMAVSLWCAILCHYYAILLYLPLGCAELWRAREERRIDWGTWAALTIGGAPLVWRAVTISKVVAGFSSATWAPAYPEQVIEYWESGLQHSLTFVVAGLAVMALCAIRGKAEPAGELKPGLRNHELVAGIFFLAIPLAAVIGGLAVTHMFTPRYALIGLIGVVVLVPMLAARMTGDRALPGFLFVMLALMPFLFVMIDVRPWHHPLAEEPLLEKALEEGPVVVADGQMFLQMWHYAPEQLRSRILFLADNAEAIKYLGFDTLDGGLRVLKPWADVQVLEYKDFAKPGREFRLYQNPLRAGWVLAKVVTDHGSAEVEGYGNFRQLYRIRLKP